MRKQCGNSKYSNKTQTQRLQEQHRQCANSAATKSASRAKQHRQETGNVQPARKQNLSSTEATFKQLEPCANSTHSNAVHTVCKQHTNERRTHTYDGSSHTHTLHKQHANNTQSRRKPHTIHARTADTVHNTNTHTHTHTHTQKKKNTKALAQLLQNTSWPNT